MPLLFVPAIEAMFYWDASGGGAPAWAEAPGTRQRLELVTPEGRREVDGVAWPALDCAQWLALQPAAALSTLPASVAGWAVASKLALGLVARERIVPTLAHAGG